MATSEPFAMMGETGGVFGQIFRDVSGCAVIVVQRSDVDYWAMHQLAHSVGYPFLRYVDVSKKDVEMRFILLGELDDSEVLNSDAFIAAFETLSYDLPSAEQFRQELVRRARQVGLKRESKQTGGFA